MSFDQRGFRVPPPHHPKLLEEDYPLCKILHAIFLNLANNMTIKYLWNLVGWMGFFLIGNTKLLNQNVLYIPAGGRGIEPTRNYTHLLKNVCIKLNFFLAINLSFFWFIPLVDIIWIKPALSDHKSKFKKMGAIPYGCNTKWTIPTLASFFH